MKDKIRQVRNDLRELRYVGRSVEVALETKERLIRRIQYLAEKGREDEISDVEKLIDKMRIDEQIAKVTELELKYMSAINSLGVLDRTIIIEGYVHGRAFWKIGQDIGYSVEGIKARAKKSIVKIAKEMNK